eukprot:PhF_6_TR30383/c0_g1_i3/m.44535/K14801/TSR4; pre-rRNA-processing protein TSR4
MTSTTRKGSKDVWLGLTQSDAPEDASTAQTLENSDPHSMWVGGHPVWLYPGVRSLHSLRCQKCEYPMSLITQVYAPIGTTERVLYVLGCPNQKCQFYLAFRAQRRLPDDDGKGKSKEAVPSSFATDDDWGDDSTTPSTTAPPKVPVEEEAKPVEIAPPFLDMMMPAYPFVPLDTCTEEEAYRPFHARCDRLMERIRTAGTGETLTNEEATSDPVVNPEYESNPEDKETRKYFKHLDMCGSQVIRWDMGGKPLRLRTISGDTPTHPPCP